MNTRFWTKNIKFIFNIKKKRVPEGTLANLFDLKIKVFMNGLDRQDENKQMKNS